MTKNSSYLLYFDERKIKPQVWAKFFTFFITFTSNEVLFSLFIPSLQNIENDN
jgi:hypothetical protein